MPYVHPAGLHTFDLEREERYLAYINRPNPKRLKTSDSTTPNTYKPLPPLPTHGLRNNHLTRIKALLATENSVLQTVRITNGVTLGGPDHLGHILKKASIEPEQWVQDREDLAQLRRKGLSNLTYDSKTKQKIQLPADITASHDFDKLPLSLEELYIGKFDEEAFWKELGNVAKDSMKRESVRARRESFAEGRKTRCQLWRDEGGWKEEDEEAGDCFSD